MSSQHEPKTPNPALDALEFELTDFDEARRALDQLPPGVDRAPTLMSGWDSKRRKPLPTDRALTGMAMDWVVQLPPALRPHSTCEQFPRVANVLAESWHDRALSINVLDHMIHDYRGGRRGFPHAVQAELEVLFDYQRARKDK